MGAHVINPQDSLQPLCACGAIATQEVNAPIGVFCTACADKVETNLTIAKTSLGWSPTPELAAAIAADSDRGLEPWALGAVQNGRKADAELRRLLGIVQSRENTEKVRRRAAETLDRVHAAAGGGTVETQKVTLVLRVLTQSAGFVRRGRPVGEVAEYGASLLLAALPEHGRQIASLPQGLLEEAITDWERTRGHLTTGCWKTVASLVHRLGIQVGRDPSTPPPVATLKKAWERHGK